MVGDIFQPTHLLFILVVALLVLGPKRLPEVGRQLGSGIRDFRAAINGEHHEPQEEVSSGYAPPVEHDLGQQAVPTPGEHTFGHEAAVGTGSEHEFAHRAAEPAVQEHEFAHETAPVGAESRTEASSGGQGEHEFASEPENATQKPADPLS